MAARFWSRHAGLLVQLIQFGIIGGGGFVVDLVVFNVLRATVFSPERIHEGPLLAKVVSTLCAIVINWLGNRLWTFRSQRRQRVGKEGVEFFAVSLVGLFIGLGCLWISHYVIGWTSTLADNISSNVVGLILGSVFRFALYRWWVFAPSRRAIAPETGVTTETGAQDVSLAD